MVLLFREIDCKGTANFSLGQIGETTRLGADGYPTLFQLVIHKLLIVLQLQILSTPN